MSPQASGLAAQCTSRRAQATNRRGSRPSRCAVSVDQVLASGRAFSPPRRGRRLAPWVQDVPHPSSDHGQPPVFAVAAFVRWASRRSSAGPRRSLVRLRAKRCGEASTKLEERNRGGGGPRFAARCAAAPESPTRSTEADPYDGRRDDGACRGAASRAGAPAGAVLGACPGAEPRGTATGADGAGARIAGEAGAEGCAGGGA